MSTLMKLYPFGFVFSDQKIQNVPEHFKKEIILNKFYYYFDENIQPYIKIEEDSFILIHGDFIHAGINNDYSKEELLNALLDSYKNDYKKFLDILDFIGGRYVIFISDGENLEFYPDAANTRSSYHSIEKNVFASHVSLIKDEFKYKPHEYAKLFPSLNNALFYTPYESVRSAIPNFKIDFYSKKYTRFFPRENNKYKEYPENSKFEIFEKIWYRQLDYYFKSNFSFVFSLTGGGDSRFSLSFLKKYLSKIYFFTYSTTIKGDYSTPSASGLTVDHKIVEQMLEDISLNHKFIFFKDDEKELTDNEKYLLSKNTIAKHSSFLIPHIQENFPQKNLKHIRGNLLEIGQTRYYRNRYKESNMKELQSSFDSRYKKAIPQEEENKFNSIFISFIQELDYADNIYDYHILDLFHWELRMGRWHSEILNTHDIIFDTINPFNHRALIDISLSFTYQERRNEYMFKELINRNFPILNFYGDNDELNLYEQQRNHWHKK